MTVPANVPLNRFTPGPWAGPVLCGAVLEAGSVMIQRQTLLPIAVWHLRAGAENILQDVRSGARGGDRVMNNSGWGGCRERGTESLLTIPCQKP